MFPHIASSTLIVVDIQERLLPAMHEPARKSVLKGARNLLEAYRDFGGNVVISEQYPKGLGSTVGALRQFAAGWPTIAKSTFSLCRAPGYSKHEIDVRGDVLLVGIETHVCVLQTGLDLLASGRKVWVPQDAVASRTKENMANGLALLEHAGATVINTESLIFSELESSESDAFKHYSKLIR